MTAEAVEVAVRAAGFLARGRPVTVMLSGGRDSTCLLDLAVRIAGHEVIGALHVNYGLRGRAADADEQHCRNLCSRLGVELAVERVPGGAPGTGNLQAWAREVRYGAARRRAGGGDIATGHTATDQVETILYRLASSPSRRALLGMRERDGDLIRPLLGVGRDETAAYCRQRGLPWREDETNADEDRFARARVRGRLVPALRAIHPAAEANVLALAATLREEAEVLDELVEEILQGRREIPLEELRARPCALARLVLQRLADEAAGRPAPGTARRAEELLALGDHAALDLPHGVRAEVRRGAVRFRQRSS
jgi:tRNA(Ile)-lysidine synthase